MSSYQTIETPQDYVNYTFNISARGVTEVAGEMAGLSNTVTTILGQLAFKTSEYLTHTESLVIGLGTASVAAFASATKEAIKFEQAIANVQAIGGESIDAMKIGQEAMKYSSQFGMDVNSMTEGLEALSRAGLTATNVMSGVLEEGVKLSKLEGMDLEDSINNLISTTNLLSTGDLDINSQEYADAVKAMNQHIVSTSESAPINAENIIQTLQHVGGYASANSIDQEDLFAVIAQLGAKGTKGEMAGTALRAFIAAGQKDQAQRALARVGLNVSDLWDESGEAMLPVSEMKDVIDSALDARGYSKQEKLEFYSDFAGYKQANQIMKIDTSEVKEYKENIAQAWDLGKKLETILGTTHNNLQTLYQTTKNFMTKVGKTVLPIINAIVIPLKWGVKLLDAMPFSENIVGMLATMAGIKAVLLFINRVVPTLGSMYTSFSGAEKKAKGVRGYVHDTVEDIKAAKDILTHLNDPTYLSGIRIQQGLMGEQSYKMHREVTEEVYKELQIMNPDLPDWGDLEGFNKEAISDLMESYKKTDLYKQKQTIKSNKIKNINERLEELLLGKKETKKADVQWRKSNLDANNEQHNNKADDFVNATEAIQELAKNLEKTSDEKALEKAKNNEQRDITKSILNAKNALAEAIGREVSKQLNGKETPVSDTLGSFQMYDPKSSKMAEQLRQIESDVSNNLGDIGYFLNYDLEKIDNLLANVRYDLQRKITAYTNNNPNFMNDEQDRRMSKIISGAAKTNLGRLYSTEQNNIDIHNVLTTGKWNNPGDKSPLGIHDKQMRAMEEALHIDVRDDLERTDRLNRIHKELNYRYEDDAKKDKIAEILKITQDIWEKDISHQHPSGVASQYLTNTRAAYIGNTLGLNGINWHQIENPAEELINYFADTPNNSKKQMQLKQADRLMFSIMESAKSEENIFNEAEADELGYIIRRYRQLLLARNQLIENQNKQALLSEHADFFKNYDIEALHALSLNELKQIIKNPSLGLKEATPDPLDTPWGVFYTEDDIRQAYDNKMFDNDTFNDLLRQFYLTPGERMVRDDLSTFNDNYNNDDDIEIFNQIKTHLEGILEKVSSLEDFFVQKPNEDTSGILSKDNNVRHINIHGDLIINGGISKPSSPSNIIDISGKTQQDENEDFIAIPQKNIDIPTNFVTPFSNYDDLEAAINNEIYSMATLSLIAMLQTFVDNVQFEIDSFQKLISILLFYHKGIEIINQQLEFQNERVQKTIDDFNTMMRSLSNQWETFVLLIESLFITIAEQQEEDLKLRPLQEELIENTRNFGEYLLGHSFVDEEDVGKELSDYVKETIKNVIDMVFNPPEKFVNIPKSNGALEDIKEKNKEPEVIIGSYRVPGEPQDFKSPVNINPYNPLAKKTLIVGKVGKEVSDTLTIQNIKHAKQERDNIRKKEEDYTSTLNYVVQAEESMNDFLNMAHNMHVELAKKHSINPDSLTENELDFIDLNKERDDKRNMDYGILLHASEIIEAQEQADIIRKNRQKAKEEKKKYKKNLKGATDDLISIRQYPTPIGPEPAPPVGDRDKANDALQRLKERREKQLRDSAYTPSMGTYYAQIWDYLPHGVDPEPIKMTALEQASLMKKQNDSLEEQQKEFLNIANTISEQAKAEEKRKELLDKINKTYENILLGIKNRFEKGEILTNAEVMLLPDNNSRTVTTKDGQKKTIPDYQNIEFERHPQRAMAIMFDIFEAEQKRTREARQPLSLLERETYMATHMMFEKFEAAYEYMREGLQFIAQILLGIHNQVKMLTGESEKEYIDTKIASPKLLSDNSSNDSTITMKGGVAYGGAEEDVRAWEEEWENIPEEPTYWEKKAQQMHDSFMNMGKSVDDFLDKKLSKFSDDTSGLGKASRKIRLFTYDLESFQDAMTKAGKIFPPFLAIAAAMEGIIGILSVVTTGLATAETVLTAARMINTEVTKEEAKAEGKEAAWQMAQRIKKYTEGHKNIEKVIEKSSKRIAQMGNAAIKGVDAVLGFIIENIAILGPIAAAIAIAVGALWLSEQNHAKALKKATEEHEEARKKASASYITYKNLHQARKNENDAIKRQQLARKESIALYKLEADRLKQLNAIKKETDLRNDYMWGEYGKRAQYQKMGPLETLLGGPITWLAKWMAGDFESQYQNYEGSTGEIRRIKEDSMGNMFATSSQRAVSAWYDSHIQQLGQIEAFAPQLQELYALESKLIKKYGSLEAARNSDEFEKAVKEFADATGINKETAKKYLDYLQMEANVENARNLMQAEVSTITSQAHANAYKILYGDEAGIGDTEGIENAMVYATADQIFKDAYQDLWWSMLMEYLQAIYYTLTLNLGEAGKHAAAAGAYQDGMKELAENQQRITQEGVDIAKEDQRKDYENDSYTSSYGDTPFGGAVASSAAQEQDYAEEEMNRQDMYYNASRANGEAATQGFKDGLNQHSPGDISRSVGNEMEWALQAMSGDLGFERAMTQQAKNMEKGFGIDGIYGKNSTVDFLIDTVMRQIFMRSGGDSPVANGFYQNKMLTEDDNWMGGNVFESIGRRGQSIFSGFSKAFNKAKNIKIDNSKTEVHIHTVNINTDDDPEKIKTALMELIIEFGDLVTPKQVSRIIGTPPATLVSSTEDITTENENAENTENTENTNTNTNNTPTT